MDRAAPWPRRLLGWLDERFPPVTYTILVVLFYGAAVAVAGTLGGGGRVAPAGAVVVWLFFLHLRIFDEHKDHAADAAAYPDRLLSRGVVTLSLLWRVGAAAIVVEAALALTLGPRAYVSWLAAFLFSVAMRFEFGVGEWLRTRIVVYAVSHNPVVAGLALFAHGASGARWTNDYWWFVAVVSLGSLAFELARKTRLPAEEHPGVASYTTELGQTGARALLWAIYLATCASVSGLLYALRVTDPWPVVIAFAAAAPGLLTALGRRRAKLVELGGSAVLLLALLAGWTAALAVR